MISSFIEAHWYKISMSILLIVTFIFLIIGFFVQIGDGSKNPDKSVPNIDNYMTELVIGQQSVEKPDKFYCPEGTTILNPLGTTLNDDLGGGSPFVQLCGKFPTTIQNTDTIVSDVKFMNFKKRWYFF